jgi:hypothetical protein
MQIGVIFDTAGNAVPGVDQGRLVDDIQAEVDKLASKLHIESVRTSRTRPPPGAQGDWASFHWVIDVATDPRMASVYARALISAINLIIQSAGFPKPATTKKVSESKKSKKKPAKSNTSKAVQSSAERPVKMKFGGKEILLPATTAAISAFLKHFGG